MDGQFPGDGGWYGMPQESHQAAAVLDSAWPAPGQFADEIHGLLGDEFEPDAIFLEESWRLGLPAATANLRHRQQGRADRELQSRAFRDLYNAGTVWFVQETEPTEFLASAMAEKVARGYDAGWHGLGRELGYAGEKEQGMQERENHAEGFDSEQEVIHPMTCQIASRLLGVTAGSTREQIKSAYRRLVSQWHPDRMERGSEGVRQLAHERMAAINEAYRLLCSA